MENRIHQLFQTRPSGILSVFFTAGYPELENTVPIIEELAAAGVDLIEIGMPYSDPIADGETIQQSNQIALQNGISIEKLFKQLQGLREKVDIPLILMGYVNPVLQYGMENFLAKAAAVGIDGLILPDLPMYEYQTFYQEMFARHGLSNIFLLTPQTSEKRIRQIDEASNGFLYVVSSASTTGKTVGFGPEQQAYFSRLQQMKLRNPMLVGFGISDHQTYLQACEHTSGAIIGSAFIKALSGPGTITDKVHTFVRNIRQPFS